MNSHAPPRDAGVCSSSLERQAVRFLLGHRLGRLMTADPDTHEPLVTPVHYVLDADGTLVTHLPADSAHVASIRRGGRSLLSVYARHAHIPAELRDDDGVPTAQAVRQVQADVRTTLIEDPAEVAEVLDRQVSSVLQTVGQRSEADAVSRVSQSVLAHLVAVRMEIESVHVRLHDSVAATA